MPEQAEQLIAGLSAANIKAFRIRVDLGAGRMARKLDETRFVRSFLRLPVFLARLAAGVARADVLHIMGASGLYFYLFSLPAILAARLFGRRTVLNFRGGDARKFFRRGRRVVTAIVRLAHVVIVPSGFLVDVFREELGVGTVVVPNICNLDAFEGPVRTELRPVFIAARHLEPIYDVACVIRAFVEIRRCYPDAALHVLGKGSEELHLRRLAEREGVSDSVFFHGYVEHSRVPGLFRRASIFLNASHVDNTPNAILEAFAAGLPVVTTAPGGIPYLVSHGVTGLLVSVGDYAAIAREALRLLREPKLASTLAANGLEVVRRSSWPDVLRLLLSVYSSPWRAPAAAANSLGKPS
jgi:phenylacetate-CoA ligase